MCSVQAVHAWSSQHNEPHVLTDLGQVDVYDGAQEQNVLILFRVLELEVACCSQHRLDGSHAIVVVALAGELGGGGGGGTTQRRYTL